MHFIWQKRRFTVISFLFFLLRYSFDKESNTMYH